MKRAPRTYHSRSRLRLLGRVLLFLLIILAAIFVFLFFFLKRYIVYYPDGLKLEIPFLMK